MPELGDIGAHIRSLPLADRARIAAGILSHSLAEDSRAAMEAFRAAMPEEDWTRIEDALTAPAGESGGARATKAPPAASKAPEGADKLQPGGAGQAGAAPWSEV